MKDNDILVFRLGDALPPEGFKAVDTDDPHKTIAVKEEKKPPLLEIMEGVFGKDYE